MRPADHEFDRHARQGADQTDGGADGLAATCDVVRRADLELSHALEAHVRLPHVEMPDIHGDTNVKSTPQAAALTVRELWGLGTEPIGHLVAHLEAHGIVCAMTPPTPDGVPRIDAHSTLAFRRPLIVLTADRADDVLRHRFSAAHELGHLVLHGGSPSGELWLEREADAFAAEFLTPFAVLRGHHPTRLDFARLYRLSDRWGVEVRSLIYRSQELELISDSTARRRYIRLGAIASGTSNDPSIRRGGPLNARGGI